MIDREYTAFFPFCGIGGGAMGFQQAEARLLDTRAAFRVVGGIDNDPAACEDFRTLTQAPALCADIATLTIAQLRAFAGTAVPDVVFLSPPCKGASGLLSAKKARSAKYRRMNRLALDWTKLMLAAWPEPPRLVLLENVPRLKKRAATMLRGIRFLLRRAGYRFHEGYHDCGELGGLAQFRRRYLLVARHECRVPPVLYQPPLKRVRACGEVLQELPILATPEAASAGPMHVMPRISWLNWVRLALIPAGGDWRDLPGVLEGGQPRRTKFRRHPVQGWQAPSATVAGSGSNGPENVADPRPAPSNRHWNKYRVEDWQKPAHTVIGKTQPGSGGPAAADPRARSWYRGVLRVVPWREPNPTVTAGAAPSRGPFSVADPRVKTGFDHGYAVLPWDAPSFTVAGGSHPGQGAYAVGDPRVESKPRAGAYGLLDWNEAAKTITSSASIDNGPFAVVDPRHPEAPPLMVIKDIRKAPPAVPVILSEDGTWHRPLTTLELAVLQGFPWWINGGPLVLSGTSSSAWRERIGNAVPPPAARSIAEQMLVTLVHADAQRFALGSTDVWVVPPAEALEVS